MITITYGEDTGFVDKDFNELEAITEIAQLGDRNLFIDGTLIEDTESVTIDDLKDASYIMVQNAIIGA